MRFDRYILSGIPTLLPLGLTWLVLDFVFRQLSIVGKPAVRWIADCIEKWSPYFASWLRDPWVDDGNAQHLPLIILWQ